MKRLLITLTILFSVLLSFSSSAEWTKVGINTDRTTYYVDFERIRKVDGYLYYWQLMDYLQPLGQEFLSAKIYIQSDCKVFRYKWLTLTYHKLHMGKDVGINDKPVKEQQGWKYPSPNSIGEIVLKSVCSY